MIQPEVLQKLAKQVAEAHGLDPALVLAICRHESVNEPYAVRYEPGFYRRYVEPLKLSDTEKTMRSTSFGLMQVMGQVAREFGFKGKYLTELCDPVTNLEYGCRKLVDCIKRSKGNTRLALLRFNGGGDPSYPDKVLQHYKGA